jgi:signal transduction histidine kinase
MSDPEQPDRPSQSAARLEAASATLSQIASGWTGVKPFDLSGEHNDARLIEGMLSAFEHDTNNVRALSQMALDRFRLLHKSLAHEREVWRNASAEEVERMERAALKNVEDNIMLSSMTNAEYGDLLEDLRTIAQVVNGMPVREPGWVMGHALLLELQDRYAKFAALKQADLRVVSSRCAALFDRKLIRRALANVLSNTIQHSRARTITLGVEQFDQSLRFLIEDDGNGLTEERLQRIAAWSASKELDGPNTSMRHGRGLLISVWKTRLAGGRLWAGRGPSGKGTSVVIEVGTNARSGDYADLPPLHGRQVAMIAPVALPLNEEMNLLRGAGCDVIRVGDFESLADVGEREMPRFDLIVLSDRCPLDPGDLRKIAHERSRIALLSATRAYRDPSFVQRALERDDITLTGEDPAGLQKWVRRCIDELAWTE